MNKIIRYKLENVDQQTVEMPFPARLLSVIEQNDDIVLYSIIDDDKDVPKIPIDILVIGTGDAVEENIGLYTFLGTVRLFDNKEIWHIFYKYTDDGHIKKSYNPPIIEDIEEIKKEFRGKGNIMIA